jgi:hypothetical protein
MQIPVGADEKCADELLSRLKKIIFLARDVLKN